MKATEFKSSVEKSINLKAQMNPLQMRQSQQEPERPTDSDN